MPSTLLLTLLLLVAVSCSSKKDDANPDTTCSDKNLSVQLVTPNIQLVTPNAISPNGDGRNEAFVLTAFYSNPPAGSPTTYNFATRTMKVYTIGTRQLVFESLNYTNDFEGRSSQGKELPEGRYYYEATLDGNSARGSLTVVRSTKTCGCRVIDPDEYLSSPCR